MPTISHLKLARTRNCLRQVEAFKQGKADLNVKSLVNVHQNEDEKINEALIGQNKDDPLKTT